MRERKREQSQKTPVNKIWRRSIHYQSSLLVWLPRSGTLSLQNGVWLAGMVFCFPGRHQCNQQDPLGSICQEIGKEDLIQEHFRHALLKQRTFHPPLLNLAQSPPKGNRAPTVMSVYFLLSWKAKVLLPLKGVTSIHQRKKWPIKAVKLVLFPLHKSTSFLYIKWWG